MELSTTRRMCSYLAEEAGTYVALWVASYQGYTIHIVLRVASYQGYTTYIVLRVACHQG